MFVTPVILALAHEDPNAGLHELLGLTSYRLEGRLCSLEQEALLRVYDCSLCHREGENRGIEQLGTLASLTSSEIWAFIWSSFDLEFHLEVACRGAHGSDKRAYGSV